MLPLLAMGFDIEGLELSDDMLDLGKKRAARMGLAPVVHLGDMCEWRGRRRYSALLAPAFTLELAADPLAALRHWHSLLERGGGLYLTVFMPYAELLGDLPENDWYPDHQVTLADGRVGCLETRHRIDRKKQVIHRDHRYTLSGDPPVSHESSQAIRWIEHTEMLALLETAGFHVDEWFPDFDPGRRMIDPDAADFDGILTYIAARVD
jgi:SAM-dependent methyltransferase